MLTVIGGTYLESCEEPREYFELYGSGLRAACALSNIGEAITYVSCVGENEIESAISICNSFKVIPSFTTTKETVRFHYYHPLSTPDFTDIDSKILLEDIDAKNILYYGLIDAEIKVKGCYVVYDPQNGIGFKETGSKAEHLALVLNKKESLLLSQLPFCTDLVEVGKSLLLSEKAEVVIIKNGSHGAVVIENSKVSQIPTFKTSSVWTIGSGDIFSASFAWHWIFKKLPPSDAALAASLYTAWFCQNRLLPLTLEQPEFETLYAPSQQRKIYLAGPFFTTAERWLINELRNILLDFDNKVFSPLHDVGIGSSKNIAVQDLEALETADVVLAIVSGLDTGTIFEVGYARAKGKRVVVFSENVKEEDLLMIMGTDCEITNDLTSAVYKASW